MGKVLVDGLARVRLCGFALAFDRLAKARAFVLNEKLSNFISEVSCSLSSYSLLLKSVTNFFKPWEILTQEWELCLFTTSCLISTPYLPCKSLVMTSNTGSILMFTRIQPFGSVDSSSLGKVYSRHATGSANWKNSSACFVMKYCLTATVARNPASVQTLTTRSGCGSLSTRSLYLCKKIFLCRNLNRRSKCHYQ